ncbi:hypothetical protein NX722_20805 [Endozoicomonas gorgoniicola]|uniref:RES domain-containing protein n=1 Tax=Endozoicomonas gorgoniicola TaxID=1234144 RepID=A0ABT3N071_9GAMM|nr:hypothetical protein [Endozoicomonas gorgoniicola]MCW7555017.1 hypothetical protein [Endozoicomonas gorgoniicola]
MYPLEALTHPSNLLELTNPAAFLNTATMRRSRYVPSSWCTDVPGERDTVLVEVKPSYFSGLVFRGDRRSPVEIFERGFALQYDPSTSPTLEREAIGAAGGITRSTGISTSICAPACARYSFLYTRRNPFSGNSASRATNAGFVYLIDAREYRGFAIPSPRPDTEIAMHNPFLKEIYEVNFVCNIPRDKVVGIVWPLGGREDGLRQCTGFWVHRPERLWLAVNPFYETRDQIHTPLRSGLRAGEIVARWFNSRW